jgi:hypothetical protein
LAVTGSSGAPVVGISGSPPSPCRNLGVETQRQWSDRVIARTTPGLLGLFSIVTLLAGRLDRRTRSAVGTDAWYRADSERSRPLIPR